MPRRKPDAGDFAAANGSNIGELLLPAPDPTFISDADVPTASDPAVVERRTLAIILDDLVAYQDTLEMAQSEAERAEIQSQIVKRQAELIGKVDRYAAVIRRLEFEAQYERAESARHAKRGKRYEAALQLLNDYAIAAMQSATVRKLDGQGATLKLRQGPGALLVASEADVPEEFKKVVIKMPLGLWRDACRTLDGLTLSLIADQATEDYEVMKNAVKSSIKDGEDVPGCDLVFNDSLTVE